MADTMMRERAIEQLEKLVEGAGPGEFADLMRLAVAALRREAALVWALKQFVDYYDQAGIGDCEEGHDDDDDGDQFDGDERFNVRHGRKALALVPGGDEGSVG